MVCESIICKYLEGLEVLDVFMVKLVVCKMFMFVQIDFVVCFVCLMQLVMEEFVELLIECQLDYVDQVMGLCLDVWVYCVVIEYKLDYLNFEMWFFVECIIEVLCVW